ncbi:MAG TPA: adenylate/guanylate cyclase domain-containing protein [Kiritimatiellia bacterium]|nr:adenylate/guanylate cyclase domain-containing protein [Kiritimatiellia bacterium]HMO97966.1 adenylate/guanylate cyclase domain-containing protein [Kiritimatiellia bacterium]HMP95317.1 adenylate/guanylate cyclase domain-containing protein [Kiritimatiellia bacterium]
MTSWLQRKAVQGLLVGAVSASLALVLWGTGVLTGWEQITWGWRVRAFAQPAPTTERIKVILIDQASLDWGAREMGLSWPWPRELYAPVLDFCRRGGAKVVAFDMLYSEPSVYMVADDVLFGEAIARASNFVGAFFLGSQAGQTDRWPEEFPRPPVVLKGLDEWQTRFPGAFQPEPRATFPVPELAMAAAMLTNVRETPDADGVFRRITPFRMFDDVPVPLLALGAYLLGEESPPYPLTLGRDGLSTGRRFIPLNRDGRVILRYRGPSGTHESLSAAAIIQSELRLLEGGVPVIDPEELRDAYVLFGVSAPGLKDLKPTPISGDYPGVEIHATFLDNLFEQDFMREPPAWWVIIATILLAIAAGWSLIASRTITGSLLTAISMIGLPFAAGFVMYAGGWWWPIMTPAVAALCAVGLGEVVNYATEGRQKRFIKNAFKQYLSGDVIEQILQDPGQLKLGGEKRELSIFFSDLQGFSAISEKLGPVGLTALLNDYLTDMSDIIMEEGGTVDKYEGDAIIAFWNAPLPQPDHAARACRAALRCQRKLGERRQEFLERTGASLFMRIGIHTGEVVVGNMGSHNRFNYTVLGDAANLASRLEGANKPFGTYLMVSEATWEQAQSEGFHVREIGAIQVVGRQTPVRVFDVLGFAAEPPPPRMEEWRQVLIHCRSRQWAEALALLETWTGDPLAGKYRRQCEALVRGELADWDGIWKLTEK